jgi:hypothetical protein
MQRSQATLAFVAAGLLAASSFVQAQQLSAVTVDVSSVAPNIAKNINVDVAKIPTSVQVPVGVAANVCGMSASTLAQQSSGGTTSCQASSTSTALDQVVQAQLKPGSKK